MISVNYKGLWNLTRTLTLDSPLLCTKTHTPPPHPNTRLPPKKRERKMIYTLARANIYSLFKQNINRVMLSGEGGLIDKKTTLHGQHTFFVHFVAVVLHDLQRETSRKFFLRRKCCTCSNFSFTFFSLPLIFSLHWWPVAFLILSLPLQNFHVVLPTKNFSFVFYLSI